MRMDRSDSVIEIDSFEVEVVAEGGANLITWVWYRVRFSEGLGLHGEVTGRKPHIPFDSAVTFPSKVGGQNAAVSLGELDAGKGFRTYFLLERFDGVQSRNRVDVKLCKSGYY